MNRPWVQNLLVIIIVLIMFAMSGPDEPPIAKVIEKAKQTSLADAKFNELYRQGKFMTTMGDNR
jgi:hypothetical protein